MTVCAWPRSPREQATESPAHALHNHASLASLWLVREPAHRAFMASDFRSLNQCRRLWERMHIAHRNKNAARIVGGGQRERKSSNLMAKSEKRRPASAQEEI